ncbi:hypothetical protein BJV78DRAFT_1275274 [Lactifluus subvellereus]|nr:hypothetical protein BJV78DRAFT_1275274 [Lactifluus subvellereus]
MTDLTILHAPSTLYLPPIDEAGLHFTFNRRSSAPLTCLSTPMVTLEMVDPCPPPSPVGVQDKNLLSPPRTFRPKEPLREIPPRPFSAPPGPPSGRTRTIDSPIRSSPRVKTPDTASGRHSSIPVRPPTTLFRPKPFWRNTRRSAVTGTSYASSLHLIRRSTFIAAGLPFDKPIADLSALGVESRIGIVVLLPDSIP